MATKKYMVSSLLGNVSQDKVFVCRGVGVIKNMDELAAALRVMSTETFCHHVAGMKNDFSTWVRDVVGDATLARQLQKVTTPATAAHRTEKRLVWLRARL